MGTKRGRLLIRQPRVKRDSDTMNQSPDTEYDNLSFSHRLTVPHPKIERHASEPSPNIIQQFSTTSSSSSHLLSVPQTPYLVKQHSHPLLLPSQSTETHYTLHRQLSYPISSDNSQLITMTSSPPIITSTCVPAANLPPEVLTPTGTIAVSHFATDRSIIKEEPLHHHQQQQQHEIMSKSRVVSPTLVTVAVVTTPTPTSDILPTIRIKGEELQRSISSPQPTRELSLENRSQHCPVIRPGPALGCNFCWNTIDAHGRILRRKTKYHCPECQTNLCIVPCFQEYHERQNSDQTSNENNSKNLTPPSLRQFPKTGSI